MHERNQTFNFSAGPATLPTKVLQQIQSECLNWRGRGCSIMEISHRGQDFKDLAEHTMKKMRRLLNVPKNYEIIFVPGGATTQFSSVPLNWLGGNNKCQYLISGHWSQKAAAEATIYADVIETSITKQENTNDNSSSTKLIPSSEWNIDPNAAYCHITPNETIHGIACFEQPQTQIPVITDMSSCLGAKAVNIENYDLIYACAQKNLGTAGITFVILNPARLPEANPLTPSMLNYKKQIKAGSLMNTAPTFSFYVASLMFDWMEEQGGVAELEKQNIKKSRLLYEAIDQSDIYENNVAAAARSIVNVTFNIKNENLTTKFLQLANERGLVGLKGHRVIGGIRASIYNSMPMAGVECLIEFMDDFARNESRT